MSYKKYKDTHDQQNEDSYENKKNMDKVDQIRKDKEKMLNEKLIMENSIRDNLNYKSNKDAIKSFKTYKNSIDKNNSAINNEDVEDKKELKVSKVSKSAAFDKTQRINLSDDETDNFPSILNKIKSSADKPSNLGYQFKNLKDITSKKDHDTSTLKNQIQEKSENQINKEIIKDKDKDDISKYITKSDKKNENIKNVIPKLSKKEQKLKDLEEQKEIKQKEIEEYFKNSDREVKQTINLNRVKKVFFKTNANFTGVRKINNR